MLAYAPCLDKNRVEDIKLIYAMLGQAKNAACHDARQACDNVSSLIWKHLKVRGPAVKAPHQTYSY